MYSDIQKALLHHQKKLLKKKELEELGKVNEEIEKMEEIL